GVQVALSRQRHRTGAANDHGARIRRQSWARLCTTGGFGRVRGTTRSSSPTGGAHTRYGRTTGRSRGHWPSAVPTARAQKTCPFIAKAFSFSSLFFRRKHLLSNVLALSRITRRVCGHVDPRLSALP